MRYQRTQIYLDPEDHRRLLEEARARGVSLAEVMREITSRHVRERRPQYGIKGFDAIIGIAEDTADPGDRDELGAALQNAYERETAWLREKPSPPRKKKARRS